ncbi:MAG: wax ester/triacylglycerol synthase family O-acyltransferase [Desulfobacterales bacterium]|nr:wax ester/triacylglycerol synthase family O-acyltransferase [Desulfobacterales bacterium]
MAETMTKADNFWLCMDEPTNLMIITAFMEFEEPVNFKRLYATIESRLASFKRFRKRVVRPVSGVGVPNWETDKNYDLRSHLQRVALPAPGDKADLQEMISNLMTTPLDPNKPLWQVHLIENYGKGSVVFFRIHHCIADGIALVHVMLSTADTEPDAPWPEYQPEKQRDSSFLKSFFPVGNMIGTITKTLDTTKQYGATLLKEGGKTLSDPSRLKKVANTTTGLTSDIVSILAKHTIMPSDPRTPFKGKLGVRKRVAWTEPMSLDKIKTVGRAISTATLNDVLIASVTGAMRRYLKTRNTPVNELDLRVAVPVNIRKPGTEFELGNRFSLVFLALPVYIDDPVLRLKEVKRRMDHLKKSPDAYVNFGLLNAMGLLPANISKRTAHLFGNKASGVLTNVPGPKQPLYFAGKKISNIMFWVPRSGVVGLGISIFSYDGKVTVGIASDEGLMPDPEALLEGFEEDFNQLLGLVQSGKIYDEPLVLHDRYQEAQSTDNSKGQKKSSQAHAKGPTQCKAATKKGSRCKRRALPGSGYCGSHKRFEEDTRVQSVARMIKELNE